MAGQRRGLLADTRPLQSSPHFRRLWTANIITVIGAQLTVVSVPAQIFVDTGSSAYVGLAGLFGLVPLVILGLYGGSLADRFDKRTLLLITTLGLIATSALFTVQAALPERNVWLLLSLFAIQQGFFALNQPARTALLPEILDEDLLPAANSLNMTVMNAGGIAGPLVAGALLPLTGFTWLYAIDTVTLLATLWAVVHLPALPGAGSSGTVGLRSVIEGLVYLAGHRLLLMSFVVDIIAMVFGMPRALFPEIAHVDFGGPAAGGIAFALLFAAIPVGAVLGGVFSGWVSRVRRHGRTIVLAIAIWGLGITVFGAAAMLANGSGGIWLAIGVGALVAAGAADMASAAFRQTMLLSAASPAVRGRLQGVFIVVVAGGPRIADVVHGGAAGIVGTPGGAAPVTLIGGVIVVVAMAVIAVLARRFWTYTPR